MVTIYVIDLRFVVCILKVLLEGSVSQIFNVGPSFFLCQKTGNFLSFFAKQFSTFHKIKTRTYIRNLRHASLHLYLMNTCLKFQSFIWNIK